MPLKKIEPTQEIYKFSDGQEVVLYAPTLAQISKSEKEKDDSAKLTSLLIDMSRGEMDKEFISSLPISEIQGLSKTVVKLTGVELKN